MRIIYDGGVQRTHLTACIPLLVAASSVVSVADPSPAEVELGRVMQSVKIGNDAASDTADPAEMARLGERYARGLGVTKDPALARSWYSRAANAGLPSAMNSYACLCLHGDGGTVDLPTATAMWRRAAEAGDLDAMNKIGYGRGTPVDIAEAIKWYKKAEAAGSFVALTNLGEIYVNGEGTAIDFKQGIAYLDRAVQAGRSAAMCDLAKLYETGRGVLADPDRARQLYQQAAAKNDGDAKAWLAAHPEK